MIANSPGTSKHQLNGIFSPKKLTQNEERHEIPITNSCYS